MTLAGGEPSPSGQAPLQAAREPSPVDPPSRPPPLSLTRMYPRYPRYSLWLAYAAGTAESVGTLLLPRLVWLGAAALVALALNPRGPAPAEPAARLDGTTEGAYP